MIGYIKGTVEAIGEGYVILEAGGIGYRLITPTSSAYVLSAAEGEVKVYTYMAVREDDISLYGFTASEELEMFKMLIGVSGIGPKGAIGILSSVTVDELKNAIFEEDYRLIAGAKGIGNKTAQKIVIELKGKIDKEIGTGSSRGRGAENGGARGSAAAEALEALMALGFTRSAAHQAISGVEGKEGMDASELINEALGLIE